MTSAAPTPPETRLMACPHLVFKQKAPVTFANGLEIVGRLGKSAAVPNRRRPTPKTALSFARACPELVEGLSPTYLSLCYITVYKGGMSHSVRSERSRGAAKSKGDTLAHSFKMDAPLRWLF